MNSTTSSSLSWHIHILYQIFLFTYVHRKVDLNGKHLQLTSIDTIPAIEGQPLPRGKPITLPSLTYGFFVINANAPACQ